MAISNNSLVTGTVYSPAYSPPQAFRWSPTSGFIAGTGIKSDGYGINTAGIVVGRAFDAPSGHWERMIWSGAQIHTPTGPGNACVSGELHAINDNDFYAGQAKDECTFGPQATRAGRGEFGGSNVYQVLDPPGVIHSDALGINPGGDVVGWFYASDAGEPFLWPAGASSSDYVYAGGGPYPDAFWGQAYGVNSAGVVVGATIDATDQAFRWTAQGGIKQLTTSGGYAHAINKGWNAVGFANEVADANGGVGAVLFRTNGAKIALGAPPGFTTASAEAVNDGLEIVGFGTTAGGQTRGIYWKVTISTWPMTSLKPGISSKAFVLGAGGLFELALLGADDLDPTLELDPAFLTLGDSEGRDTPVARDESGRWLAASRDVDGDHRPDLVLQFDQRALEANGDLTARTTVLKLRGAGNGYAVTAQDTVVVVQR